MPTPEEIKKSRLREYGEPLVSSPKLREALNDEQATELIDWGMETLSRFVDQTIELSDAEAGKVLDLKATAVSLIMTLVNQMMVHPGRLPDEDIVNDRAVRLGKNLFWLTGHNNRKQYRQRFIEYEMIRETAVSEDLFQHIMAIIHAYDKPET